MGTPLDCILNLYKEHGKHLEIKGVIDLIKSELKEKEIQSLIDAYKQGMIAGDIDGNYVLEDIEKAAYLWYVDNFDREYLYNKLKIL